MALFSNKQFAFLVLVAVALGVLAYFKGQRLVKVDLNPTHQDNLANRLASWLYGGGLDGQGTLGTDAYEVIHEDIPAALQKVNPTNNGNVINQGAVSFYQWLTGSEGTPGSDLAGWVHD